MNATRKIATTLMLVALCAAISLAGCGKKKTVRRSQMAEEKPAESKKVQANDVIAAEDYKPVAGRYGGRMVLAGSEPKSFNPITAGETTTTMFTNIMYLGLTRVDSWTFEPTGQLAESWEVDESGLVWTIKLKRGVLWSDGVEFTADDVVFTYDTIYDDRWVCSMRDIISGPDGERWKVEKIDDYTVRFTLFDVNAIFLNLIAAEIIPMHAYKPLVDAGNFNEALGTDTSPEQFVGTGPYIVSKYEIGRAVTMRRNPNYYRKAVDGGKLPYLDELVFVNCPDTDVQIIKFRNGELDITGLRGEDYPSMKDLQAEKNFRIYRLGPAGGSSFVFFNMNTGVNDKTGEPYVKPYKLAWFRDVRFRQAISHLVDRDFLVSSVLNGLGYPQYGPLNEAAGYYFCNPDIPKFEYDPDKAKALLAEMGLLDRDKDGLLEDDLGHPVEFTLVTNKESTVRVKVAETIRGEFEKAGIKVNFRLMNFNELISRLDFNYEWEACVMGLTGGPEPLWGGNVWRSSGRLHMWFPRQEAPSTDWEAEIDRIFTEAPRELDRAVRRKMFFRWQEIVGENQPLVYTVTPEGITALRNRFGNIFPSVYGGLIDSRLLHNIDEIYELDPAAR